MGSTDEELLRLERQLSTVSIMRHEDAYAALLDLTALLQTRVAQCRYVLGDAAHAHILERVIELRALVEYHSARANDKAKSG